jgi:para-aminobenzoate synthetase
MGILIPGQTIKVSYETEPRMLRYGTGLPSTSRNVVIDSIDNLWALLQQVLDVYSVQGSPLCLNPSSEDHRSEPSNLEIETCPTKSPFWGGFMGYISYEAGLETIDVPAWPGATESQSNIPDVNFAFV